MKKNDVLKLNKVSWLFRVELKLNAGMLFKSTRLPKPDVILNNNDRIIVIYEPFSIYDSIDIQTERFTYFFLKFLRNTPIRNEDLLAKYLHIKLEYHQDSFLVINSDFLKLLAENEINMEIFHST